MSETNYYAELAKINVGEHIEKKGKFSYLSWAYAVDVLRKTDPEATWEVKRFDGVPFMKTECGYFVEVAVTVKGITLSQIHPVLDNYNKPIQQPNSFQINTSIQRCLVKAIALHGLGLYIYAGEDLPTEAAEEIQEVPKTSKKNVVQKPKQIESEKQSTKETLIAKWVLIGGTEENFDAWYVEQTKKYNNNQIDVYLTKKLQAQKKGA